MITDSKEKPLTKKIIQQEEENIGFCTDCDYSWCLYRGRIFYCSLKFKGIRGYICQENHCNILD